jgi:ABC-2 type transport system permease protein
MMMGMHTIARYLNLWASLARFSLLAEMAFRGNFVVKVFVELLWLAILLLFNFTLFEHTRDIADWDQQQYLFFLGCYFAMGGLLETLFLSNCNEFAELVRTGDLDFFLLRPVDEQFLVSCRNFDWSCAPNVLLGGGVMAYALWGASFAVPWSAIPLFIAMFVCGAALAYGFLLMLTAASVWFMRNQSLMEMWWLFGTLMRYPREIFLRTGWVSPIGLFFSTVVPVMLVTNVPAEIMAKKIFDPVIVLYTALATVLVLWVSRRFFRAALQRYRSASS